MLWFLVASRAWLCGEGPCRSYGACLRCGVSDGLCRRAWFCLWAGGGRQVGMGVLLLFLVFVVVRVLVCVGFVVFLFVFFGFWAVCDVYFCGFVGF